MSDLVVRDLNGVQVRQRQADGYINATELCKAAGKQWGDYARLGTTIDFIQALSESTGIPVDSLVESQSGRGGGTWVHPDLAVNLATWCSPRFAVRVAQWAREILTTGSFGRPGEPHQLRPWADRWNETFGDHYRYVCQNFTSGAFSVLTGGIFQYLILEDQILRHEMSVRSGDRPDISVGRRWSIYARQQSYLPPIGEAPIYLPDQKITVPIKIYDVSIRGLFEYWMNNVYLRQHLYAYLDGKKELREYGILPRASTANSTCNVLTGMPANLPLPIQTRLRESGGFVPALRRSGQQTPEIE